MFKNYFRRLSLVILGLLILTQVSLIELKAQSAHTLIVNYHRFDGNYTGWSLWLWQNRPNPGDGQNINFTGSHPVTGSRQLVFELEGTHLEGADRVGVIVRTGDWTKDVPIDLFIDLTKVNADGVVEVFLVSQDPTVYYGLDEVDLSHRVQRVDFTDIDRIAFTSSTSQITASDVRVLADGVPVSFREFSVSGFRSQLTLNEPADLTKSYVLEVTFFDQPDVARTIPIGFGGVYASDAFNDAFYYDGALGALYENNQTTFKLWAPIASEVVLNLYEVGHPGHLTSFDSIQGSDTPLSTHPLTPVGKGVWQVVVEGDLHGVYYTYDITNNNITHEDVVDPYTRSTGVNGLRGMVVDFSRLNPENWRYGSRPDNIVNRVDSIIYEAHIRDYTAHSTWNGPEEYRGKYLGFAYSGTRHEGLKTGFDHIVELGVTHVQLLPVHDIGMAIDETRIMDEDYQGRKDTIMNWGYMTLHFNTLEGSYATDPFNGSVRIEEFKQLVQTFHEHDIRVILDVVYNHTATSGDSNFEKILPGYFFRFDENGNFSNGSGTGNETASENAMMRKFIVDSLIFWTEEFNISGYRFDLMRLHDVETMRQIRAAMDAIDPTILVFGEPWDAGGSQLDPAEAAYFPNSDRLPGVGFFNDDMRDGIKGSVFDARDLGWIQGNRSMRERVRAGLIGAGAHDEINYPSTGRGAFAQTPDQNINYATAHDNNTLHDKLFLSEGLDAPIDRIVTLQKQANAIVLTAQGIPFLHGGVEIMRTKPCVVINNEPQGECDSGRNFDHNSYRSPDETNAIDWQWKVDYKDVFDFYQGLIALRKAVDIFRYTDAQTINNRITFAPIRDNSDIISFFVYDPDSEWEYAIVAHNNIMQERTLDLLGMEWELVVSRDGAGLTSQQTVSDTYRMMPGESVVMYRLRSGATWPHEETSQAVLFVNEHDDVTFQSTIARQLYNSDAPVRIVRSVEAARYFSDDVLASANGAPLLLLNGDVIQGAQNIARLGGDTSSNTWLWVAVGVIAAVGLLGAGTVFFLKQSKAA